MRRLTQVSSVVIAFGIGILGAGCNEEPTGPNLPSGVFDLVEIEGRAIPAYFTSPAVPGVDGHRTLYKSSVIQLNGSKATYDLRKSMEWPIGVWTDVVVERDAELVRRLDDRYEITATTPASPGPPVTSLRITIEFWRADSLMTVGEAGRMLYIRR